MFKTLPCKIVIWLNREHMAALQTFFTGFVLIAYATKLNSIKLEEWFDSNDRECISYRTWYISEYIFQGFANWPSRCTRPESRAMDTHAHALFPLTVQYKLTINIWTALFYSAISIYTRSWEIGAEFSWIFLDWSFFRLNHRYLYSKKINKKKLKI